MVEPNTGVIRGCKKTLFLNSNYLDWNKLLKIIADMQCIQYPGSGKAYDATRIYVFTSGDYK